MDDLQSTAAIPDDYLDMEHKQINEKFSNENQAVKDLYESMLSTRQNDGRYAENNFVDRLVKLTKTPWGLSKRHRVGDAKMEQIYNNNKVYNRNNNDNNNNNNKKKSTMVKLTKSAIPNTEVYAARRKRSLVGFRLDDPQDKMIRLRRDNDEVSQQQQENDSDEDKEYQDDTEAFSDQDDNGKEGEVP